MSWLNQYEVESFYERYHTDPVLGPGVRYLKHFLEFINEHSDGWAYWSYGTRCSGALCELISQEDYSRRGMHHLLTENYHSPTLLEVREAAAQIAQFVATEPQLQDKSMAEYNEEPEKTPDNVKFTRIPLTNGYQLCLAEARPMIRGIQVETVAQVPVPVILMIYTPDGADLMMPIDLAEDSGLPPSEWGPYAQLNQQFVRKKICAGPMEHPAAEVLIAEIQQVMGVPPEEASNEIEEKRISHG